MMMMAGTEGERTYIPFGKSVRGNSHIRHDIECQDSCRVFEGDGIIVFALGDGHGDSSCPRSGLGSEFLCEIAVEDLKIFAAELAESDSVEELLHENGSRDRIIRQLVSSIFGKWGERVRNHFGENSLTEDEKERAQKYLSKYEAGERIEHAYGTTFIAGVLTNSYLLLLQQGDGQCVVVYDDGRMDRPIPWDERCFANVTTSVCDTDAVERCRYRVIDIGRQPIAACIAGSDGLEDSFSSLGRMESYYRSVLLVASQKDIEQYLEDRLPKLSRDGSGDDMTVCGFLDQRRIGELAKVFERADREMKLRADIADAEEHLASMEGKLTHLTEKRDSAQRAHEDIKGQKQKMESEMRERCKNAEGVYKAAERELKSYKKKYDAYEKKRSTAMAQLEELNNDPAEAKGEAGIY